MKVSELISDLETLMSQSGDCEVLVEIGLRRQVPLEGVRGELRPIMKNEAVSPEMEYVIIVK